MPVARGSVQCPNALLLPGPGGSRVMSVSRIPSTAALVYVILDPAGISRTFEDVIVQMSPLLPVNVEHSFSMLIVPLRTADAASSSNAGDKSSVIGFMTPLPSQP